MSEAFLLETTGRLLECVRNADWAEYSELCDPTLTCFEPETVGHLVEGMSFHAYYFQNQGHLGPHQDTIVAPHVRMLGADAALVAYTRLVQRINSDGHAETLNFQETRIWQRIGGAWKHVHFHRSREL